MKTKQMSSSKKLIISLVLWFTLVLIGCNLGTSTGDDLPTLAPRNTATPPPTIGFNGSGGNDFGGDIGANPIGTAISDGSVQLRNMMQQVDAERLILHVRNLQNVRTRHINSSTSDPNIGIGAARTYIYNQFVEIRQSTPHGGFTVPPPLEFDYTRYNIATRQQNIVAVLQGTEPGAGFIVVGAHYDSIGPDFSDPNIFAPGANDNGTGVAALIEIARVLSQKQYRSSIIFVAFSAEEHERGGSKAFVQWAQGRNMDIAMMLNIDSIGNANNSSGAVDYTMRIFSCQDDGLCGGSRASRSLARAVELLSFENAAPMPMSVEDSSDREGRYGDHFSFAEAGYPAIRFINRYEEFGNGSSSDTVDFVERDYLHQATQSILSIIVSLANGPQPPRQITMRTTDDGSPSLRWENVFDAQGYIVALRLPNQQKYDQHVVCAPENGNCDGTSLTWGGLVNYAGVSIAAQGNDGLIGRFSEEFVMRPGS